jgi:competence protein ComEA
MSTKERHALAILIAIGLAGHAIRIVATKPDSPPGGVTLLSASGPTDLAAHRARSVAAGRPLTPGERIDLNSASASDLARIPGVGPGLATRLVSERRARGGFVSLAELDSVPGIGAATFQRLAPFLSLGDTNRVKSRRGRGRARSVMPPPPPPPAIVVLAPSSGPVTKGALVRINSASVPELDALPGIGPSRAKAIIAYRQANGPFASMKDLEKVPGLTPSLVRKLAPQVIVP